MTSFEGFSASDFDVFEEKKWGSHAFNRERLEVKLKLTSLGNELKEYLPDRLSGLEMGMTEGRPSIFNQHKVQDLTLFFFRNEKERRALGGILDRTKSIADIVQDPAAHHRHIIMGVRVGYSGVEAGLWLHRDAWVDWKNAVQRCGEHWERNKLSEVIEDLPESIRYGRGQGLSADAVPSKEVKPEEILGGFGNAEPWTVFGERFGRDDPVLGSGELSGKLVGLFAALVSLYSFIGWRRDNDFHELKEAIKEQKEKATMRFKSFEPGDQVRVLKGLASGHLGVVDSLERKGVVKVRLGTMVVSLKIEELGKP
jgi:transcription antitermination factor NusG